MHLLLLFSYIHVFHFNVSSLFDFVSYLYTTSLIFSNISLASCCPEISIVVKSCLFASYSKTLIRYLKSDSELLPLYIYFTLIKSSNFRGGVSSTVSFAWYRKNISLRLHRFGNTKLESTSCSTLFLLFNFCHAAFVFCSCFLQISHLSNQITANLL